MAKIKIMMHYDELVFIDKKNSKILYQLPVISVMELFIDRVMSRVYPKARRRVTKAERKEFILKYLESLGFIRRKKTKKCAELWAITDKCCKAIMHGGSRYKGAYYLDRAISCVPGMPEELQQGLKWDHFHFFECLGSVFWDEDKSFFRCLANEIDIVKTGLKILPKKGIRDKAAVDAIGFGLTAALIMQVESCSRHYISKCMRRARRR